jgi:tetratricopeptide (TPR) repeat protein
MNGSLKVRLATGIVVALALTSMGCPNTNLIREKKAEFHYKLANNFFYAKNTPSAIKELYTALSINQRHAKAHHLLGFIYFGRRDHIRAVKHLQMAVTISPDFHEAIANLGNLYLAMGEWVNAIPYFERLLNKPLYRTPYLAHNNLGWALFKLGRLVEAKRYMELAVFYNPKFCLGHNNLGRLYSHTGNTRAAIKRFHKAIDLCPKYLEPNYFLGRIYLALQLRGKAQDFFKRCHELAPDSPYGRRCGEAL